MCKSVTSYKWVLSVGLMNFFNRHKRLDLVICFLLDVNTLSLPTLLRYKNDKNKTKFFTINSMSQVFMTSQIVFTYLFIEVVPISLSK